MARMNPPFYRSFARLCAASALFVLLSGGVSLVATVSTSGNTQPTSTTVSAPSPSSDQVVKIKGTFEWQKKPGERHNLEGILTRTSSDEWKATWNFTWSNKPETFKGVVHGNPLNGNISGTGCNAKSIYSFEGKATDGVWKFDCFQGKQPQGKGEATIQR